MVTPWISLLFWGSANRELNDVQRGYAQHDLALITKGFFLSHLVILITHSLSENYLL